MKGFEKLVNKILEEIRAEEKIEEERKQTIIKNGCPHTDKIEKTGLVYKAKWLECTVCGKQFDSNGRDI